VTEEATLSGSAQTPPPAVGLIGLGLMGSALADRLLEAGKRVVGWDVNPERVAALREKGGAIAGGAPEVFSCCRRVLLSLPSHREVGDVIDAAGASLSRGHTIIDTTTGDPSSTLELARILGERGIGYLDATISGSSAQVRAGSATLMVGGDAGSIAASSDVFESIARQVFHTGAAGTAAKMKLVTNLVLGLNRAALAEGLAFAGSVGLDLTLSLAVMRGSAAFSRIMDTKGERMIHGDFAPDARLSQHLKDVRLIVDIGRQAGLPMTLSAAHRAVLEEAETSGYGELDNSAIIKVFMASGSRPVPS
jgi:3-hydroxyisobutyrate dehydrogenase-like beta-hydroxyacid dehydrogenase